MRELLLGHCRPESTGTVRRGRNSLHASSGTCVCLLNCSKHACTAGIQLYDVGRFLYICTDICHDMRPVRPVVLCCVVDGITLPPTSRGCQHALLVCVQLLFVDQMLPLCRRVLCYVAEQLLLPKWNSAWCVVWVYIRVKPVRAECRFALLRRCRPGLVLPRTSRTCVVYTTICVVYTNIFDAGFHVTDPPAGSDAGLQ